MCFWVNIFIPANPFLIFSCDGAALLLYICILDDGFTSFLNKFWLGEGWTCEFTPDFCSGSELTPPLAFPLAWLAKSLSIKALRHGVMALSSASVKLVLFFMLMGGRVNFWVWGGGSDKNTESFESGDEGGETFVNSDGNDDDGYCCCCCGRNPPSLKLLKLPKNRVFDGSFLILQNVLFTQIQLQNSPTP